MSCSPPTSIRISASQIKINALGNHVSQLVFPAGLRDWLPGQYIALTSSDTRTRYFSIASLPGQELELHVQHPIGFTHALVENLEKGDDVDVSQGQGQCSFASPLAGPLVLVAGGTGFAQALGVLRWALAQEHTPQCIVLWGLRTRLPGYDTVEQWPELQHSHVKVITSISDDPDWQGEQRSLPELLAQELPLSFRQASTRYLLCGSSTMVEACAAQLAQDGVTPGQIWSDMLKR